MSLDAAHAQERIKNLIIRYKRKEAGGSQLLENRISEEHVNAKFDPTPRTSQLLSYYHGVSTWCYLTLTDFDENRHNGSPFKYNFLEADFNSSNRNLSPKLSR